MTGNQIRGTYRETTEVSMRCFDLLPAEVREIMRNSIHKFATSPRLGMLHAGMSVGDLVDHLINYDARLVRDDAREDWAEQKVEYIAAQRTRKRRDWYDKPPRSRL